MPLQKLEIQLDNSYKSFFAGQNVSGKVFVLSENSKLIHGLKINLHGRAKTHWTRQGGRIANHFIGKEILIDTNIPLCNEDGPLKLEGGREYSYHFSFHLPNTLPSSFSYKSKAQIKYHLEATISRKKKENYYTSKLEFTVNGTLDLNLKSEVNSEMVLTKEKIGFCCPSGPFGFKFKMIKSGFVPGEQMQFEIQTYNQSNWNVNRAVVQLVQALTLKGTLQTLFRGLEQTKIKMVKICQVKGPKVPSGNDTGWITMSLKVPVVPPTRLDGCRIIGISYHLKLKMVTNGATLKDYIPIVIGTIPLRNDFPAMVIQNS